MTQCLCAALWYRCTLVSFIGVIKKYTALACHLESGAVNEKKTEQGMEFFKHEKNKTNAETETKTKR